MAKKNRTKRRSSSRKATVSSNSSTRFPNKTRSKTILIGLVLAIASAAGFYLTTSTGGPHVVDIRVGDCVIKIEIADTPQLREKGLSGRKTLKAGHGMLFVYELPNRANFWMKDTSIPLSIAFISTEGIILQIEQMTPFDLNLTSSRYPAKFALEVNQGFFQENGITVGDIVDLTNVIERGK